MKVGRLANETGIWPLYEDVDGEIVLSRPGRRFGDRERRKPISEYFEIQGRYKGVSEELLKLVEEDIESEWAWLKRFMK